MATFMSVLVIGLVLGVSYALVALGLSIMYGVLGIVNFAHGELLMVGAYVGVLAFRVSSGDLAVALLAVGLVAVPAGYGFRLLAVRAHDDGRGGSIVATLGIAMLLFNLAEWLNGHFNDGQPQRFAFNDGRASRLFGVGLESSYLILGVPLSSLRLLATVTAILAIGATAYVLARTQFGRSVRAIAWSSEDPLYFGVDVRKTVATAVVLSVGITMLAGVLVGGLFTVSPTMGVPFAMKAFAVVVCAGFGNITATLLVGCLFGVAEAAAITYWASSVQQIWPYALLSFALVLRPTGLVPEVSRSSI